MTMKKDEAKGRVEEATGALTDDDELKREGKADQAAGEAKEFVEDVAEKAEEIVDKAADAVHKDD